nr:mucin-3A-like [Megalopta genalis]XP_033323789.1 mucin-3A-like [Megalopta genalis]XP_033323790.1 mucin-3A-like [Megalopta genalis]XP_033323791.1 mucin-3A-like [Megalopta genalis]XP_033323792.1 mucin-3A-like [Megalopta genalis]
MCEQTEINYLDGDVVWVKLGACWWPGQVTGFHNLPKDIQDEFQKKPLIAAVKFFQEDTYEFVKNYQQIYKYNCTQKDEFIKKGLDKYRSKSKDGSRYMDKFPGDVEMAEKLTGGDPDILNHDKFCPEEKPNISALFGDKKVTKKKKEREDTPRRSDSMEVVRKITHPRFLKESDHEVRIRQQPSSLPSTPNNTGSPQYPCHLCNFTSSRVNVIICHIKSHRSGNSPMSKTKVKTYSQYRGRHSDVDTPKRKYVKKDKSQSSRSKSSGESAKRKQIKQNEKAAKKKKTDPKIRDTILADWEDESDEDISLNQSKQSELTPVNNSPTKSHFDLDKSEESGQKNNTLSDPNEIIAETEKLLKETEKLTSINILEHSETDNIDISKNFKSNLFDKQPDQEKDTSDVEINESANKSQKGKESFNSDNESKYNTPNKDDRKSLLSCFDFHEEELSIPPVRKKARAFHQKKEIIKEFEMSQALKTEQEKEAENKTADEDNNIKIHENEKMDALLSLGVKDLEKYGKSKKSVEEDKSMKNEAEKLAEKSQPEKMSADVQKSATSDVKTELKVIEIFEAEKSEDECKDVVTSPKPQTQEVPKTNTEVELTEDKELSVQNETIVDKSTEYKSIDIDHEIKESTEQPSKDMDEASSERFTTETEDETVSESADTLPDQSENSDADMLDQDQGPNSAIANTLLNNDQLNVTPQGRKRRGRPRKSESLHSTSGNTSGNESPRIKDNKSSQKLLEKFEVERRISESDSERSYSGRKRKPNKKYLESDIYVQELDQRIYKTDESQSESEEKGTEKGKGRTKRNKKLSTTDTKISEKIELEEQKELEISCNVSNVSENNVNSSSIELQDNLNESDTHKDEIIMEADTKDSDNQVSNEIYEKMSSEEKDLQAYTSAFPEDIKSQVKENVAETKDTILEPENAKDITMETENLLSSSEVHTEKLKTLNVETCATIQPEISTEKDISSQTDILKTVEMLPPKKSQIKKFELSQIDFFDSDATVSKSTVEPELDSGQEKLKHAEVIKNDAGTDEPHSLNEKEDLFSEKLESDTKNEDTMKEVPKGETKIQSIEEAIPVNEEVHQTETETSDIQKQGLKLESSEPASKDAASEQQSPKKSAMQTRYKGKFTPETGAKSKKDKELFVEEKSSNTFQEAFLKTLHIDKKKGGVDDSDTTWKGKKGKRSIKKKLEEDMDATNSTVETIPAVKSNEESPKKLENLSNIQAEENNSQVTVMSNFEGIEVVVDQNVEMDTKTDDTMLQNVDQLASSSSELDNTSKSLVQSSSIEETSKSISIDIQKVDESSRMSTSTPSPSSDIAVPVKKREMPRIIENVTLTEPMQILKSKLLDKFPQKGIKHKLETESTKRSDQKAGPKAKVMKIESLSSNTKMKTGSKVTSHMSLTKKLQVLKAEEAETAAMMEAQNEQLNLKTSKVSTTVAATEKFIQQSSQSLADMELDINSMPFVLSEDVLTPENIEQMPVVISSIIPASSTIPATLSFTPTTQIMSATQTQYKLSDNTTEVSPTKKKSGTPAILKNKSKAKPTITSIKTLVPPLTGGVKGIKFQSTPATSKVPPLLTQKGTPGKYVVVQTSGGQQLRYSVQGKPGTQQKIAIPTGKAAGNAQVVQQGGKVVILTSAQSGQTKMLPLNIAKTLGSKVQRIMTSKGQVLCPISPQGIINSKTVIAPKGDGVSPTTSKLPAGHKIINTQGIITSKGVLTPISGTIGKTALLGTLSQGILTKGGIYTPISASTLGGKTIIGSKTLVTKGATILSSQNLGTSKAILTPISQAISGKTILSPQGISSKTTVLTPITGQQVKAIAAKSPSKGSKVQYQSVQQKVQLPMLQKSQKVGMSSSQGRSTQLKGAANTVVLQNPVPTQKTGQGKRIIKQTVVQQGSQMQNIATQSGSQQTMRMNPQIQKGKGVPTSTIQKVIAPRGGRQSKTQQKIVVQKVQEPTITAVQNIQTKQNVAGSLAGVPGMSKMTQQKHSVTPTKSSTKGHAISKSTQQQKNLLNIAMNSAATANVSTTLPASLSLPPLEPIEPEKKLKMETILSETIQKEPKGDKFSIEKVGEAEKLDESKITTQPQIMALPTESSDGTQTYVLVTIDEQGQIQPLDNNALMSLEGTTQNPDGTRTLYIDPSSLGEAGTLDNIVLQFDNGVLPNIQTSSTEPTQTIISESFPTSEVIQTSNQDILAAALANTDFQQEINLSENPAGSVMTAGLTQTSLINQTILQSTIIPPTEPISSPSVLETSLTLNQPIMTPLEVPSNLPIQSETTPSSTVTTIPTSLELPITITNPSISYISTGEAQIQIPGNSMPDIGEIMESSSTAEITRSDVPVTTQYLVLPNLESNITTESQKEQNDTTSVPSVSYSVSIPNSIVIQTSQVQTTPSMPIIDDTYTENVQFGSTVEPSIKTEQSFVNVAVSEMLVSKPPTSTECVQSQDTTVTSEMNISQDDSAASQEPIVSTNEPAILDGEQNAETPLEEVYSSQEVSMKSEEMVLQSSADKEDNSPNVTIGEQNEEISNNDNTEHVDISEQPDESIQTSNLSSMDETGLVTSESSVKMSPVEHTSFEVSDSNEIDADASQESENVKKLEELTFDEQPDNKVHSPVVQEQAPTSNEVEVVQEAAQILPAESLNRLDEQSINMDEAMESKIYAASTVKEPEGCQRDEPSSQGESDIVQRNLDLQFEETNSETSHETPSQSYEQFGVAVTTDSTDLPSQSAIKSENSREPSQSITYEPMETDEEAIVTEPPSQSFEHSKMNEASQSYETSTEENTNAPTQSFNELMQSQEERATMDEGIDDQTFPTQSYDVGKAENISETLETDTEISQEGNMPSQSNDIGADGIGTSSVSTNNSGLNEDETASSSYVPETPENQERDPDQESAISTSSCEIPPCAELNIASSSAEHTIIHDNGVPEIPTSSYNLNPDITSTHVDSVPTSSYEEQNVSTSYEVPISMPGLEETPSQNFVTESTDHRNEPSSYYAHHQEVTASYYEPVGQETNSRLDEDPQEEVTPSYYEGNPQEASQSYFNPEEATPSYSSHNVSPSYYDHRPESEASQSYYSTDDIEKSEQSSSQNIEASQSFYQEQSDELKLRQQGEATPTYTERYPVDYTLENSPIERHDLVESSVPATRPTER